VLTGRSGYSAEGRFAIWSNATDLLLGDAPVTGLGPDVYRQLTGVELHNDFLSFAVERGPLGLLALLAFGVVAFARSLRLAHTARDRGMPSALVFPAALVGMATVALTHEIFHQRPLWVVLALQEALIWRLRRAPAPAVRTRPQPALPGAALQGS
jgi:O-antigen ligase